jgi:hypothetical protein
MNENGFKVWERVVPRDASGPGNEPGGVGDHRFQSGLSRSYVILEKVGWVSGEAAKRRSSLHKWAQSSHFESASTLSCA